MGGRWWEGGAGRGEIQSSEFKIQNWLALEFGAKIPESEGVRYHRH